MSEEIKEDVEKSDDQPISAESADNEEENNAEEHVVLPYPDRVPNVHKGTSYKHSYVMIGLIVVFIIFSIIASFLTSPL